MMRLKLAAALTFGLIVPAYADIDADFTMANRIFGQVAPNATISDIDGEWLPLTLLSNVKGEDPEPGIAASLLERICGNDPVRGAVFTSLDDASFEMTAPNSRGELTYRFDWVSGSQFYRSFDPAALFSLRKFDAIEGERGVEMRARTLQAATSQINIYRISPDLLALAEPGHVELFGRCPQ